MRLFGADVRNDKLVIDVSKVYLGMPADTDTTHQTPIGPHCI